MGSALSSAVPTLKRKHGVFMASDSSSSSAVPTLKRKHDALMASGSCSSSSVPTLSWKYDVFLSFRGEDTRYNFVDHLYAALARSGISVFKDDKELKTGKAISPELLKAIEESKFAVVVFSKKYADSSWCLAELAKIIKWHNEMGQKVIPVFYHVDPSDIRGQKKEVAVFFQQHENKFREELDKVEEWREALKTAANLSGHHISETCKKGESSYISKIVKEVLADRRLPYMESHLVGIESHMDALNSLLRIEENDEVLIVGIHGMGGIGKTTIAKALFRRIADKFEGSSFVNDVREKSSKGLLCALQKKVLKEILMINHKFKVRDPEDGANMIRAGCVHKKVLIVLDDVDNSEQLKFLAATHGWFGPGSRIIITTRNEQLLSDANAKYKPNCLLMHEALELFSRHAFKRDSPPEGYEELSRRAIHYAGYLPLAVEVLGPFFHNRRADLWESAFSSLAKEPDDKIFKTLKLSYDGLKKFEKKIFLDIACFFKGKRVQDVTKVLESCGFDPLIGISVLSEKALITISDGQIGMHDLIQEMGWQIVRESFPNSRLWQLEDIHDSLKNNRELEKIEAIMVSDEQYDIEEYEKKMGFSANVFENMNNLRLLVTRGRFTSSEPTVFPDNLRWLSWSRYPFSSLPMTDRSKLVGLEVVGGTIEHFWNGQKIMPNLKIIKLQHLDYLTTFPDVSEAPNIEELFVHNCSKLVEFHESLGSHKRISKLFVYACKRLKCLPSRLEMESLRALCLEECSSLERFPDVSPCMVKLSEVRISCCSSIEGLLSSLGYLSSLNYLLLERDESFWKDNTPICKEHLEKHGCRENLVEDDTKALESLPKIESLTVVHLCGRPTESDFFVKNLQSFPSLASLDLSGNNSLIQIPATISRLYFLNSLKLNECQQLQILHGLPSRIQALEAINCYSLEKIVDLSEGYDCLHVISFMNCQKLLKDEDSKTYLEKMSRESFFKRYAFRFRSISIPGNKIPSWFKEEPGSTIRVMIPPKCNNQIKGIVICAVFPPEEWQDTEYVPWVDCYFEDEEDEDEDEDEEDEDEEDGVSSPQEEFDWADCHFEKDGVCYPKKEFDCVNNASPPAGDDKGNTYILYKSRSSIEGFERKESSGGVLKVCVTNDPKAVRCAAHLIYEEDVESTQQNG